MGGYGYKLYEQKCDYCPTFTDCTECMDYVPEDQESWCGFTDAGCALASKIPLDATGYVMFPSQCPSSDQASTSVKAQALRIQSQYLINGFALVGIFSLFYLASMQCQKTILNAEFDEIEQTEI